MESKIRSLRDQLEAHKQSLVVHAGKEGAGVVEKLSQAFSAALLDRSAFSSFEKVHQWTDGDCPTRYRLKFDSVIINELNDWILQFEHAKTMHEEWSNSRAALDHYREKVADLQTKERSSLDSGKALSSAMREKMMRNNDKLDTAEREFATKRGSLLQEVRALRSSAGRRLDGLLLRIMQWEQSWLKDMYVAVSNGYKGAIADLQQRSYDEPPAGAAAAPAAAESTPPAFARATGSKAASSTAAAGAKSSPRSRRGAGKSLFGKPAASASASPKPAGSAFEPFGDAAPAADSGAAGGFDPFGTSDASPGDAFEPRSTQDDVWGGSAQDSATPGAAEDDSADLWGDAESKPAVATEATTSSPGSSDLDDLFGAPAVAHGAGSGAFTAPAATSASFDPFGEVQQQSTQQAAPAHDAHFDPFA